MSVPNYINYITILSNILSVTKQFFIFFLCYVTEFIILLWAPESNWCFSRLKIWEKGEGMNEVQLFKKPEVFVPLLPFFTGKNV